MPISEKSLQNLIPMEKGNPAPPGSGRPKGSPNLKTTIAKWLRIKEAVINPITKRTQRLSQQDIMVLTMLHEARAGNVQAFNALADRLEGKPDQKNSFGVDEGTEIEIRIGKPKIPPAVVQEAPPDPDATV